nr:dTMP kinase [Chloroflexota bacterium]
GGTAISERVRTLILDPASYAMLPETEALLYAAARAQLVGERIRPALSAGTVVVCDRFVDSSLAYQAGGRGLAMADVWAIQQLATGGLQPDLRILLDLPVRIGLRRRLADHQQVNRLDTADIAFHERVRDCYWTLARQDPAGWIVLDANVPPERLAATIAAAVSDRLRDRNEARSLAAHDGGAQ